MAEELIQSPGDAKSLTRKLNLAKVYVNDFDDGYNRLDSDIDIELERSVARLKSWYRHYDDYVEAVNIYNDYIDELIAKNGGPERFSLLVETGIITLPNMPKLKKTKINKFMMKNKTVVSKVDRKNLYDLEEMENFLHNTNMPLHTIEENELGYIPSTVLGDEEYEQVIGVDEDARTDLYSEGRKTISLENLEQFVLNTARAKERKARVHGINSVSLTGLMNDEYSKNNQSLDGYDYYKGKCMRRSQVNDAKLIDVLGEVGWNKLKIAKVMNLGDSVTNLVRRERRDMIENERRKKNRRSDDELLYDLFGDMQEDAFNSFKEDIFGVNGLF